MTNTSFSSFLINMKIIRYRQKIEIHNMFKEYRDISVSELLLKFTWKCQECTEPFIDSTLFTIYQF